RNTQLSGAPAPIFARTTCRPRGVLKLSRSSPAPNFELEIANVRTARPCSSSVIRCSASVTRSSRAPLGFVPVRIRMPHEANVVVPLEVRHLGTEPFRPRERLVLAVELDLRDHEARVLPVK